jgi:hypothetical protein
LLSLKTARARSQRGCDETASPKYLGPIVKLAIPAACGKSRRVNGAAAVGIMRAVKQAIDPNAIVKSGQDCLDFAPSAIAATIRVIVLTPNV